MTTLVMGEGNLAAVMLSRNSYNAFKGDAKPAIEEKKTNKNANHSGVNVSSILCLSSMVAPDTSGESSLRLLFRSSLR